MLSSSRGGGGESLPRVRRAREFLGMGGGPILEETG